MTIARPDGPSAGQRIDKWLWCARIVKTRTLGTRMATGGGLRLTRAGETHRIEKASALVRPGDSLAFMLGGRMRILDILACGARRGPATEAQCLYADRSPPPESKTGSRSGGRPEKKDRRALDRLRAAQS